MLTLVGVKLGALQMAGGLALLISGLHHITGQDDQDKARHNCNIAIVPMCIPMMAGPAAFSKIITMVAISSHQNQLSSCGIMSLVIMSIMILLGVTLYYSRSIVALAGKTTIQAIASIGFLVIACLGVDLMSQGLYALKVIK